MDIGGQIYPCSHIHKHINWILTKLNEDNCLALCFIVLRNGPGNCRLISSLHIIPKTTNQKTPKEVKVIKATKEVKEDKVPKEAMEAIEAKVTKEAMEIKVVKVVKEVKAIKEATRNINRDLM